jgi:hypothetical protein
MKSYQPLMEIEKQYRHCALCGGNADTFFGDPMRANLYYNCKTCGTFLMNASFGLVCSEEQRAMLSAYCRRNPGIWVLISNSNFEELCTFVPRYTPPEMIDRLLQVLGERSTKLGKPSNFDVMNDYPLIAANGWQEAKYLIGALIQKKYVLNDTAVPIGPSIVVTMDGWSRIEDLKTSGRSHTQCFVAMAFRQETNAVWGSVIEPSIRGSGYKPFRIDREHHVNRIDDEIIAQIRRSRFMVADFTLQRGGVYFEAGMMQGLGRNVIWMCHESELTPEKGLHFDIRQFNFLTYSEPNEDIKKRLYERILAIEGEGPLLTSETNS